MKKTYTKPYLAVESFQLDAAIATSCSEQNKPVLSQAIETCNFLLLDKRITQFGNACPTDVINTTHGYGLYNTLCYHGPVATYSNVFMTS